MNKTTQNIKENLFEIDIPDTETVIKEQTEWFKVDLPKKVVEHKKKPDWLRVKLPIGPKYTKLRKLVEDNKKLVEENKKLLEANERLTENLRKAESSLYR